MTFRETLDKHLRAIQERDLLSLADTVAEDEIVLVMADGRLARSAREFLEAHRGWFAMDNWRLETTPVHVHETPEMGVAVLHLVYRETPRDRPAVREESFLTLVFEERDGRWLMVLDQNTPIKAP